MALENFFEEGQVPGAEREDLFDLPAEPHAESSPPAASVAAATATQAPHSPQKAPGRVEKSSRAQRPPPPFDPVLDEDIFQFDECLLGTQARNKASYVSKAELMAVSEAPAKSAPEQSRETAASPPETVREAVKAIAPPPLERAPAARAASAAPATLSGRTTQVALAAILVVNAAFVFFAWQASDVFRDALHEARDEIASERAEPAAPEVTAEHETVRSESIPPHAIDEWVASLESPVEITFKIAEREIADGHWASARRRLYALLATQDRNDVPRGRLADAQYWIAEAWSRESAATAAPAAADLREQSEAGR